MSQDHAAEVDAHVRTAMIVFGALMVLTAVTVGVYYLHLPTPAAIALALFIALVKGSLVASFFMHLISEKKMIYALLIMTAAFFVVLLLVPVWTVSGDVGTPIHAPSALPVEAHDGGH